ncbi:MAG: hypothetical protein QMD50_00550 [Patescibacteria group bacterium]|nr:hypothetical protein [Patescibacteria group bacterium]
MKNFVFFLVMIFALTVSVNAQIEFGIKVTLDPDGALKRLGIGQGTDVIIENNNPFYARLFSGNKLVGVLVPGQTAIARNITTGFDQTPLALVAKMYSDENYQNFVGASGIIIWINGNPAYSGDRVKRWVIDFGAITFVDNRYSYYQNGYGNLAYPFPKNMSPILIKLPTLPLRSITEWQFVNVTLYDAVIEISGVPVVRLASGAIYYDWKANDRSYELQAQIVVRFCQGDLQIGRWDGGSFEIAAGGNLNSHPHALQYLLGPDKNQRPY